MNRFVEIAALSGIMATTSVAVSVYGIAPYNYYAAWVTIGFAFVSTMSVVYAIRFART